MSNIIHLFILTIYFFLVSVFHSVFKLPLKGTMHKFTHAFTPRANLA